MAAIHFVYAQVVNLRQDLTSNIVGALWGEINRAYWSVMGRLDEKSIDAINSAIDSAFERPLMMWRNVESVGGLLERSRETLKDSAWVALSVPWPGDGTDAHVYAVRHNLEDLFDSKYFGRIHKAMLAVSPSVLKIQRAWRRALSDPSHLVCRRRLFREFDELKEIIK
jgi:hypothetical protein